MNEVVKYRRHLPDGRSVLVTLMGDGQFVGAVHAPDGNAIWWSTYPTEAQAFAEAREHAGMSNWEKGRAPLSGGNYARVWYEPRVGLWAWSIHTASGELLKDTHVHVASTEVEAHDAAEKAAGIFVEPPPTTPPAPAPAPNDRVNLCDEIARLHADVTRLTKSLALAEAHGAQGWRLNAEKMKEVEHLTRALASVTEAVEPKIRTRLVAAMDDATGDRVRSGHPLLHALDDATQAYLRGSIGSATWARKTFATVVDRDAERTKAIEHLTETVWLVAVALGADRNCEACQHFVRHEDKRTGGYRCYAHAPYRREAQPHGLGALNTPTLDAALARAREEGKNAHVDDPESPGCIKCGGEPGVDVARGACPVSTAEAIARWSREAARNMQAAAVDVVKDMRKDLETRDTLRILAQTIAALPLPGDK